MPKKEGIGRTGMLLHTEHNVFVQIGPNLVKCPNKN